jgi:Tol biopolymer transport system component
MRRTVLLTSATVVVALVAACVVALLVAMSLAEPAEAAFPGLNGKIAFAASHDKIAPRNWDIYTTSPRRLGSFMQVNITNSPSPFDSDPDWAPNGKKIAFDSYRKGNFDIYVMNANGTGRKRLTNSPALDSNPAWSPDGTKIVFTSTRYRTENIFVMDADGTDVRMLTDNGGANDDPSWSPDGTKIAFQRYPWDDPANDDTEIYTINVNGTGEKALTHNQTRDFYPDWSPDGQRIVFQSDYRVIVMNADGTDPKFVCYCNEPSWSPNGERIALVAGVPSQGDEIAAIAPDGSHFTIRTHTPGYSARSPDWRPRP